MAPLTHLVSLILALQARLLLANSIRALSVGIQFGLDGVSCSAALSNGTAIPLASIHGDTEYQRVMHGWFEMAKQAAATQTAPTIKEDQYRVALTHQPTGNRTDCPEVDMLRKFQSTGGDYSEAAVLARTVSELRKKSQLALERHDVSFVQARPYAIVAVPDFLWTTFRSQYGSIIEIHYLDSELWRMPNEPAFWYMALWRKMSRAVAGAGFRRTWLEDPESIEHAYNYEVLDQYAASATWAKCAAVRGRCWALYSGSGSGYENRRACEEQHNVIIAADMSSHSLSIFVEGLEGCGIDWSPWSSHTSLSILDFSDSEMEKSLWMSSVRHEIQDLLKRASPPFKAVANSTLLVKGPGWTDITLQGLADVATQSEMKLVVPKHPIYIASMAAAAQALNHFEEVRSNIAIAGFGKPLSVHDEL